MVSETGALSRGPHVMGRDDIFSLLTWIRRTFCHDWEDSTSV